MKKSSINTRKFSLLIFINKLLNWSASIIFRSFIVVLGIVLTYVSIKMFVPSSLQYLIQAPWHLKIMGPIISIIGLIVGILLLIKSTTSSNEELSNLI